MVNKLSPTEDLIKSSKTIDQLNTLNALNLILEDQKKSIFAIQNVINEITILVDKIFLKLNNSKLGRLIYTGAGTSGRIAIQDGVELLPTFGWPSKRLKYIMAGGRKAVFKSVEFAEDDIKKPIEIVKKLKINYNDVVIGVAASGNTPFTSKVIESSSENGAMTIAISNNPKGKILKYAKHNIILDTKGEVIAGSTRLKAGTSQKICLNLISTMLMVKLGNIKNGHMVNMIPTNKKLLERQKRIERLLKDKKLLRNG